jgi:serine/threonine-protein kinase SRPK3
VLAKQCLIGLDYLNRICKLIHTDLKPENVVISLTKDQLREIYDNGCLTNTKAMRKHPEKKMRSVIGADKLP